MGPLGLRVGLDDPPVERGRLLGLAPEDVRERVADRGFPVRHGRERETFAEQAQSR